MSNLQISIFVIEDIINPVNFSNKPSNDLFVKLNSQDKKNFVKLNSKDLKKVLSFLINTNISWYSHYYSAYIWLNFKWYIYNYGLIMAILPTHLAEGSNPRNGSNYQCGVPSPTQQPQGPGPPFLVHCLNCWASFSDQMLVIISLPLLVPGPKFWHRKSYNIIPTTLQLLNKI